jgi:hypothetical protein
LLKLQAPSYLILTITPWKRCTGMDEKIWIKNYFLKIFKLMKF